MRSKARRLEGERKNSDEEKKEKRSDNHRKLFGKGEYLKSR